MAKSSKDTYRERDQDAATRDLTVNDQHAAGPQSERHESLPAEATSYQVVVGDIPRQPPGFQPRRYLMRQLNRRRQGVAVLTGVPGAGKTQLAAAYARAKLAEGWRLVAWVNAADSGNLAAGLAAVTDAAGLSDGSEQDSADAGVGLRRWLDADGDRCLLVFDDAEDPDALRPFIPAAGAAQVLITSTQQSAANLGTSIPVDAFSADEASAVLVGRTGRDDEAGAAAVTAVLGHLPLALALAAPVIAGQHVGYARYLDRLQAMSADVSLTGDDEQPYATGAARTVLLSLRAVRAADQAGVCTRVMEMVAVLSAAGVRRELLHAAGQAGLLVGGRRRVAAGLVDRVLEWLSDRSLLTYSLDGRTIILHRLVAQVVRDGLTRRQRLATACLAAASSLEAHAIALARAPDRPAIRSLPQQVTALLDNMAGLAGEADTELARILLRLRFITVHYLIELGDSTRQAITAGEPLTADLERLLGPDHPDTSNARNSLAAAYLAAGRVAEAIPQFEQTLAARQRVLGPDHPDTLTSQNNLAAAYQDANRPAEAIQLYQQTLAVRERLLGPGHPSTLNSRGNLAAAYLAAGGAADAIPLLEHTRDGRERVLGPDHPDTQTARKNLARAYREAGQVAEAIAPAGQTLAAQKRQPPADTAGQPLPGGFRRPPADPTRQPFPDGVERPSAELADHSSTRRTQDPPPTDVHDDRGIMVAITAGDPAGIAMAYDRYAAALYSYCHWMLHDSADAAEALLDTFVIAVATLSDLSEPATLRPWLFAQARNECRRRNPTTSATRAEQANPANQRSEMGQRPDAAGQPTDAADRLIDATMPTDVVSQPAHATDGLAQVYGDPGQAELRTLINSILAELRTHERELLELSFGHDLYDNDPAIALGASLSRVHAAASRAHGRLEEALAALHVALTRREACPVLGDLLADWDGRLTGQTREYVVWHVEKCEACAHYARSAPRPAAFSRLLPLAPLPPELREHVLSHCSSAAEDVVAYRPQAAPRAEPTWLARFSQTIRERSWDGIRANPGAAIATAAVVGWVVAAAVTLLILH